MSGPGTVTILRSVAGLDATKTFSVGRGGKISKTAYGNAKFFSIEEAEVDGFPALVALLRRLERDPKRFIIRGAPLDGIDRSRARRLLYPDPETGDAATFAPGLRRWAMFDLDGVPNPAGLDPRVPGEAEEAIEHLVGLLPPEFADASLWWQWSSGMCAPTGTGADREPPAMLRAHLWAWLDRPIADADLERWAKWWGKSAGVPLDPAPFRSVQPNYIARPIFRALADPLPRRSGLREGLDGEVALVLPEPEPARAYDGHGSGRSYGGGFGAGGGGVDFHLARIGPDGYQGPIMAAVAAFFATHGPDADPEPLKARIRERVHATIDHSRVSDRERYTSDRWLDGKIAWARAREAARPAADPAAPPPPPPEGSPEAAQAELNDAIATFFARVEAAALDPDAPPPCAGIRAPAGLGKTTKLLTRPESEGRNVCYFVPEHRLGEELVAKLPPDGLRGLVIRGRAQKHPAGGDGETMCAKADLAEGVARINGNIYTTLCRAKVKRGSEVVEETCEHYNTCPYIQQFEDQDTAARFMPHAYLSLPKPAGMPAPDLVVIDERFWQSMMRGMNDQTFIPLARLQMITPVQNRSKGAIDFNKTADLAEYSQKAFSVFEAAMKAGRQPSPADLRAAGLTAAACKFMYGEWYSLVENPDITPAMPAPLQRKRLETAKATEAHRQARFWRILVEEIDLERDRFHGLELAERANRDGLPEWRVIMRWSADLAPWIRAAPILLLDADLDERIARRFLPQLAEDDLITIEAERRGAEVVQIADRTVSKSMLAYPGGDAGEQQRAANRRADLRALAAAEAARTAGEVLAVTYQRAEEAIRAEGELPGVAWSHFNAIRGKDGWKDVAAVIVAGRPQPSVQELERITRALFHRDPRPIEPLRPDAAGNLRYPRARRAYPMAAGRAVAGVVEDHPDPLAAAVLRQIRECELVQAIDRARLIWRDPARPCRVLVLTNVPLPVTVHTLTTWDDLIPTRFVRAFWRHPATPLSCRELARCFPDLWPSRDAVLKDWEASQESGEGSLLDYLIGIPHHFPPYRALYRRPGQRGSPSPALIRPARGQTLRAALEAVVGLVTEFRVEAPDLPQAGEEARAAPEAWGLRPCPPPAPAEAWRICGRQAGPISPPRSEHLADAPPPDAADALKSPARPAACPVLQEQQPVSAAPADDFLAPEDDPAEAVNWAREPLPDAGDPERPEAPLPDRPRPVADPDWAERARAAAEALRRLGGAA